MSEPTLGEVVRRLEDVVRQVADVAAQLSSDRRDAAQTYVNRETYRADQRLTDSRLAAIVKDVGELDDAREKDIAWRRVSSFNLAITSAGWLVTIALALFMYLTR